MFFKPSVFCSVSLVRSLKNHIISVPACFEHSCGSKQTKEALHSTQNILGCSAGKIFVVSQCCPWCCFIIPKKCVICWLWEPLGGGAAAKLLQRPGKAQIHLFFVRVMQCLSTLPVCAVLPLIPPSLRQGDLLMVLRALLIPSSQLTVGPCQLPCAGKCEGHVTSSEEILMKQQVSVFL